MKKIDLSSSWILVLTFISTTFGLVEDCRLRLKILSTTNTSIELDADYDCADVDTYFKAYYKHAEWISCDRKRDQESGSGFGDFESRSTTILFRNLHPHSLYELTIKAIPGNTLIRPTEESIHAKTRIGVPNLIPKASIQDIGHNYFSFAWSLPSQDEDCIELNGATIEGLHYSIKGISPWNSDFILVGSGESSIVNVNGLSPYSDYKIDLRYITITGNYNTAKYLTIRDRTSSDVPDPPRDLRVRYDNEDKKFNISWKSEYPPKGSPEGFMLYWSNEKKEERLSIPLIITLRHCLEGLHCYSLEDVASNQPIEFKIEQYNIGVDKRSSPSKSYFYNPDSPVEKNFEEGLSWIHIGFIILASFIVLVLIILIAMLIFLKMKGNKSKKYTSVPLYETQPSQVVIVGPRNDDDKTYSQHSIQSIPLPPLPGENVYEELSTKVPELDEDMYLKPRTKNSSESLDVEDYLKPTFNKVTKLGIPEDNPPPIPIESYSYTRTSSV